MRVNAYGPMLCEARIAFQDKTETTVGRYLDFEGTNHQPWIVGETRGCEKAYLLKSPFGLLASPARYGSRWWQAMLLLVPNVSPVRDRTGSGTFLGKSPTNPEMREGNGAQGRDRTIDTAIFNSDLS